MGAKKEGSEALKNIIILDLDGTTCNDVHRQDLIRDKDYDAYHALCSDDPPIKQMVDFINAISPPLDGRIQLWACTGRDNNYRVRTIEWCGKNNVHIDLILMRPSKNYEPAPAMKIDLIERELAWRGMSGHMRDHILAVIDDRDDVCDAFRERGILALQTGPMMELKSNG